MCFWRNTENDAIQYSIDKTYANSEDEEKSFFSYINPLVSRVH